MIGPPASTETKIAITERASQCNLSDMGQAAGRSIERRRTRLQYGERAHHFTGLMIEPFLLVMLGRAPSGLVHREDRSVENAIAQRLQPQRRETCVRLARNDPAAAGTLVKKFKDDAGVVIGGAVFGNQHRNFAERILPAERVGRIISIGGLDPCLVIKTQKAQSRS